uniref:BZIP domain-containing protein n=1 Tax=Pseudo-nitzschia australis TaxID=44445 RepID=A0A7S4AIL9_9STRA
MTNPNQSYHLQQEDAIRDIASYPMLVKSAVSQSTIFEGESTAPNSTSSSPLSFEQRNMNMNMTNSNHNIGTTTNHDSWGMMTSNNNHSVYSDKFSRDTLSPRSAPATTSIPVGWNPASARNTPVPSVIHTEADVGGDPTITTLKTHGSTPYFPSIDRSCSGNMSVGSVSVSSSSNLVAKKTSTKVTGKKKHQASKLKKSRSNTVMAPSPNSPRSHDVGSSSAVGAPKKGHKKQRRLERNRLSAQLSRKRRKQYLEELEDRVVKLSLDMDSGRRAHASQAIDRISEIRRQVLASAEADILRYESSYDNKNIGSDNGNDKTLSLQLKLAFYLRQLENAGPLSRANSEELLILNSFLGQQLKSFSLPSHSKFILWLTLQGDIFYRGGRAASERLSAARIGEKMLASGTDKVTPASAMWPLICNEVGLSYELEERLRVYQRTTILQDNRTWLDRHTARSSALVMQSFHDTVGGLAQTVGHRENKMTQRILTPLQRVKFLAWAEKNAARIKDRLETRRTRGSRTSKVTEINIGSYVDPNYSLETTHHLAANLYILNHQLQRILKDFPYQSSPLLTTSVLKKLMRRASFESLGQQQQHKDTMTRDESFVSMKSFILNDSLIKSPSNQSLGGLNDTERSVSLNQITPQVGEQAAVEIVDQFLGFVKPIIPPIPKPIMSVKPVVHAIVPTNSSTIGPSQTQDVKASLAMDYHNHCLAPIAMSPYVAPASSALVPPSNQHVRPMEHFKDVVMHHVHTPTQPQLHVHDYSAPSQPPYQAFESDLESLIQQPQQAQAEHYYPPQQHNSCVQPLFQSLEQRSTPPVYDALSPVLQQQQQQQKAPAVKNGHVRKSSFLPPHLNSVPLDMMRDDNIYDDDFLELMGGEDDWGVGEGLDMDTTS